MDTTRPARHWAVGLLGGVHRPSSSRRTIRPSPRSARRLRTTLCPLIAARSRIADRPRRGTRWPHARDRYKVAPRSLAAACSSRSCDGARVGNCHSALGGRRRGSAAVIGSPAGRSVVGHGRRVIHAHRDPRPQAMGAGYSLYIIDDDTGETITIRGNTPTPCNVNQTVPWSENPDPAATPLPRRVAPKRRH